MATVPKQQRTREIKYPTRDGKPMAETELHMQDMIDTYAVKHPGSGPLKTIFYRKKTLF